MRDPVYVLTIDCEFYQHSSERIKMTGSCNSLVNSYNATVGVIKLLLTFDFHVVMIALPQQPAYIKHGKG